MAHTYALGQARTSSSANPITQSYTVAAGVTVVCLMMKVAGSTNRAGGAPTWGASTFVQPESPKKGIVSPECSAELWYLLNPPAQTRTLTIPNTSGFVVRYTLAHGLAKSGAHTLYTASSSTGDTSTNPDPGPVVIRDEGTIGFGIVVTGAQAWNPSAQAGTAIANTDDGADGGGEQYKLNASLGSYTLGWTFGTSDDYGAIVAFFREEPAVGFNNYLSVNAPSGISVGERIR